MRPPSAVRTRSSRAFTLLELVIVIAIIAILAGLTGTSAIKVMALLPRSQTATEIGNLALGLGMFQADFNMTDPPPSTLLICEDGNYLDKGAAGLQAYTFFQKTFGRNCSGAGDWNGNGTIDPPYLLQGHQCLLFYLGGIPIYTTDGNGGGTIGFSGFSQNKANPAAPATPGARRYGPYYQFATSRLKLPPASPGGASFPIYYDPYQVKGKMAAYAYFSSQGRTNWYTPSDCAAIGAQPYYQGMANNTPQYVNPRGYQIICAGADGTFGGQINGPAPGAVSWQPLSGQIAADGTPVRNASGQPSGNDDQTNFTGSLLGFGQQ